MKAQLLLDPAMLRDQIALLRGVVAAPRLEPRKRFLATQLLELLHTLERCARDSGGGEAAEPLALGPAAASYDQFWSVE